MKTETITVGSHSEYPLSGTLTLPDNLNHPVPAVVLVHGSGASDQDEKVGKLKPFRDLSEGLAVNGIASLRYDKRTFVHARKMMKQGQITINDETIEDAVKAADLLRMDARIASDQIFIIGHSMGAMLAPRIDDEGGNFRGLILMAGSPYKLEEILIRQMKEISESSGFIKRKFAAFQLKKYEEMFHNLYDLPEEETKKIKAGGGTTLYYFREMGDHPAEDYLLKTEKPVLILHGSADFQSRADTDFRRYQEILEGHDNVSFKLYDGLNHLFVPSAGHGIGDAMKEYSEERHIPAYVIKDIAEWIKASVS